MGLRISTPTLGVIAPPITRVVGLSQGTNLEAQNIYVYNGSTDIVVNLPSAPADGAQITIKNIGTAQVQIASALVEGVDQTIEIDSNRPVTLVWTILTGVGWVLI